MSAAGLDKVGSVRTTLPSVIGPEPEDAVTVTVAEPLALPLVAVMTALPAAMPLTRPLPLTVANPVAPLLHVTGRPVNVLPAESFNVAVN